MSRKIGRSIILLGIMVLVLILPLAARAEEISIAPRAKTTQEIQAYKERARLEKAGLVEQEKARLREQKQGLLEQYRERLRLLKDTRKQTVVDRLNNRMCTVNKNQMAIMNNHLDRILAIVNRVAEKANLLKTEGRDVSTVETAVEKAKTAIADAQKAAEAQGSKECVINITGLDTTVGAETRNSISKLEAEIKAVRTKVTAAREAVSQAIRALAKVVGDKITVNLQEDE